jgi:hypothetical protein
VVATVRHSLVAVVLSILVACAGTPAGSPEVPGNLPLTTSAGGRSVLADLPLSFIENRGQADRQVSFYVQGSETSVYFTPDGLRLALADTRGTSGGWNLALDFVGATRTIPEGRTRARGIVSYFKGDPSEWHTSIPTFSRVAYRDLWPGIDLVYSGSGSELKYEFQVAPGADPSRIKLRYRGAEGLRITSDGALAVSTPARTFTDAAPVSWQGSGEVVTSYQLDGDAYGFDLGEYDPSRPLVIDPAMLLYAGYIGGSGADYGNDVAVDDAGNAYVIGDAASTETTFPESVGPDLSHNGGDDVFVAKVNAGGASLGYAGFIGGDAEDSGSGIAVDDAGNAYVTGQTGSSEGSFPVTVGPDTSYAGGVDAFVARVDAGGASLGYAGYIGGTALDAGLGIAVDGAGNAYVDGSTESSEGTFPDAVGPDLSYNGGLDAFVARVDAGGASLGYAGYIGGGADDSGGGIAVDGAGNAYVTGSAGSTEATFPETVGPDLSYNGGSDAYVARVNAGGASLGYAGFIGGTGGESADAVAVDAAGNAYVVGHTTSTEATFPDTIGPDLSYNGGTVDAFVARVDAGGASLGYAGYIGGSGDNDFGRGIAVDAEGNAYVTGYTDSTEATFPVVVGPDLTHNGGQFDAFVAKVNAGGASLGYAGYIGGDADEFGQGINVDGAGNAYVTGYTSSTEATFPVVVGPDLTHNGGTHDAFVAKVETTEVCKGKVITHLGSGGNDTLTGTSGPDVVLALGGNDTITTLGGADIVCAGDGNDKANGGGGSKDLVLGEKGNDKLSGGGGSKDRSVGGPGKDKLSGGGGKKDACKGGPGKDKGGAGCEKGKV